MSSVEYLLLTLQGIVRVQSGNQDKVRISICYKTLVCNNNILCVFKLKIIPYEH